MSEDSWIDVAATRLALIEQLKAEKGRLESEVIWLKRQVIPETVTRVTVMKGGGIVSETFADQWQTVIQDDGRTLKLFSRGGGAEAQAERDAALGEDLVSILGDIGFIRKERRLYCNRCGGAYVGSHECLRQIL